MKDKQAEFVFIWLNKLLKQITSTVHQAGQFLEAELPLFVKEYLLFTTAWYTLAVIALTIIMIAIISWIIYAEKHTNEQGLPSLIGIMVLIVPTICLANSIHSLMLVTFVPRVFLVKEFVGFFK